MNLNNVPYELKQLPRWLGHRNKAPINLKDGSAGSSTNPNTWVSFETAKQRYKLYECDGIGLVLCEPFVGIDLDDCVSGGINGFAQGIIEKIDSYTEYSPSGTGIHIICKGTLAHAVKKPEIEIYNTGRYFTMTGNVVRHCPVRFVEKELEEVIPEDYKKQNQVGWIAESLNSLKPGNLHNESIRIIGKLHQNKWSQADIYTLLQPHIEAVGGDLSALKTRIESISRYPVVSGDNILKDLQAESEGVIQLSSILAEQIKTEWLVGPELISKQSLTFLVGLPEAGKTWLLMDLAIGLASGTSWMGKYRCRKSKVLYLDQERSRASTVERFQKLLAGKGYEPKDLNDNLVLRPQSRVKLDLPHSFEVFDRYLAKVKPDVLLIDSFKKFHSKNELSTQDMQVVFTKLEELKDKHSFSTVFIHHETKGVISKRQENFEVRATDASGTIDLQQTAEHFFNLVQTSDGSMLYHTKNNLGDKVLPCLVKVENLNPDKSKIAVRAY